MWGKILATEGAAHRLYMDIAEVKVNERKLLEKDIPWITLLHLTSLVPLSNIPKLYARSASPFTVNSLSHDL